MGGVEPPQTLLWLRHWLFHAVLWAVRIESLLVWTHWIDEGYGVYIVYLDYSKAFDPVDHVKLIEKLFNISIDD